jgi:hypothetical protein
MVGKPGDVLHTGESEQIRGTELPQVRLDTAAGIVRMDKQDIHPVSPSAPRSPRPGSGASAAEGKM